MHLYFFFSSRRRHTRWPRDWSSDVCSSDLSVLTALLDRFDLVGTSSGWVLPAINLFVSLAAAISTGRLVLSRPAAGSAATWLRGGALLLAAGAAVIAGSVFSGSQLGLQPLPLQLESAQLLPPLLLLAAFALTFQAYRGQISELTQTQLSGWMFIMPALLLMLIWIYLPAVNALWISLFKDFNYLGSATFVGLENYAIALRDPLFIRSLVNKIGRAHV